MVDIATTNAAGANLASSILVQARSQDAYKAQALQLIDAAAATVSGGGGSGTSTVRSDSVHISPQARALYEAESCG